VTPKYIMKN